MGKKKKTIIEVDESELLGQKEAKKTIRVLAFCLSGENYCIDIKDAREVVRFTSVAKVPNMPEFIVGVINFHGEIISLIDIRYFFGLVEPRGKEDVRIIVTDIKGSLMGILVDRVKGLIDIEEALIQPPLATIKGRLAEYTRGQIQLDREILMLLDLGKILGCEEMNALE
ncbi:MAG: hypothetical protein DRP85_05815 [Candidatus Makaraimicrobium thalassicum]|nr:MAG: hypothetical protein DRP85_05815 [Candidatus Omnitrophota bacterium]